MTLPKGELYPIAMREVKRRARGDALEVSFGWEGIQEAAWKWLWERRTLVLFRVRVLGFTLYTLTAGGHSVRELWERAFGTCPFKWKEGPR